ncbi:MAG TPA: M43 family zinc metalloprotease [Chryseosolibacter sp.]|nr:M43 family zinc metalloprotease [Chryseosolibacter sp.]
MKLSVFALVFFSVTLCCSVVNAQTAVDGEPCGTMEQDRLSRLKHPDRGSLEEFEHFIQEKIHELEEARANGRTQAIVVTIPIVVHVVHNGEPLGSGTNLSQAQVQAQIEVLNEDFRRKPGTRGYNDSPVGADIEIEFCLAYVDKNGNQMAESGIHRYDGGQADWTRDQIENKLKPNTIWDPNKFYNIWTVKFAAAEANLLGYAQFPDQSGLPGLNEQGGPAATDGVVVRYQSFGSVDKGTFPVMQAPYNKGRTLTHETGHWLGLRHIWGDGSCAEDFVSDTPPAAGPSSGCPVGRISCGNVNMVQNYMDYSEDACMNIFTQGQKTRMRAVMEVSPRRKTLLDNNLCVPVVADVPEARFTLERPQCILLGSEVSFVDLSTNFPSEWNWIFEGGDPNTSTQKNPRVTYNTAGTYDVTLIVKNDLGADTLTIPDYVTVTDEGLCRTFNNFLPEYSPSVLSISDFAPYSGYLTGHNTANTRAFSEYFSNNCGYKYISGASVRFGVLNVTSEDTKVTITVWNARGKQNSPGAVIERKQVLAKQILDDIANDRPTTIVFDRETPVFSKPFHVGVEIEYNAGYELAIVSSANEEATTATSWVKLDNGEWKQFTIAYGANIAMDIAPEVGMNPSVQVSASKILVYPGEQVTLNGRGASIFVWNASDGSVTNVAGPQLTVNPIETTTYIASGSGLELCNDTAMTTVYVREDFVGTEPDMDFTGISLAPNPGGAKLQVTIENGFRGIVNISIESSMGQTVGVTHNAQKSADSFSSAFDTRQLSPGLYIVRLRLNGKSKTYKWIKL